MRFKLLYLFFAVTYVALVLATLKYPFDATLTFVQTLYGICYASTVVVACHQTGSLRTFCIALSAFGLILRWHVGSFCPEPIESWLSQVYIDPDAKNGYWDVDLRYILTAHATFIVAFVAATISAAFVIGEDQCRSQDAVLSIAEPTDVRESPS